VNRRNFLATSVAALFGPPSLSSFAGVMDASGANEVAQQVAARMALLRDMAQCGFLSISPRGMWRDAQRAWRRDGKPAMTSAEIWEKYRYRFSPPIGEIGRIEGFRFIVSKS